MEPVQRGPSSDSFRRSPLVHREPGYHGFSGKSRARVYSGFLRQNVILVLEVVVGAPVDSRATTLRQL